MHTQDIFSEDAYNAANEPKELMIIPNAGTQILYG